MTATPKRETPACAGRGLRGWGWEKGLSPELCGPGFQGGMVARVVFALVAGGGPAIDLHKVY